MQHSDPTIRKAEPGNPWSVGAERVRFHPELKIGRDLPYEMAGMLDDALLYHKDTMEPLDLDIVMMNDEKYPYIESKWYPDELTPEVMRKFKNPRKHHPYWKAMCKRIEEDEFEQARVTNRVRGYLDRSSRRRVPSVPPRDFLNDVREAASRSRQNGGSMQSVVVSEGNHSLMGLPLEVLALKEGASLNITGPGGCFRKWGPIPISVSWFRVWGLGFRWLLQGVGPHPDQCFRICKP